MKWLADENFPITSFKIVAAKGWDIKHISFENPSIQDFEVIERAINEERIILTFDSDFGTLVFKEGHRPLGVIYFRLPHFLPEIPAQILLDMEKHGFYTFEFHFTVIDDDGIRQRTIPK